MQNVLLFLARYRKLLFFIFLEAICFYWIVSFNKTQKSVVSGWGQEITGRFYKTYNFVNYYFHLKEANDSLLAENARLKRLLPNSLYIDTAKMQVINDTIYQQRFEYIPAHIINNSITFRNNYLTLAGGNDKGISKYMGVISTAGIVGITQNVTNHFSSVISILHKDFKVSAEIQENGEKGSIIWDGHHPDYVLMKDIPVHIKLQKGQKVVTSAYSNIFPQGTPVGSIAEFEVKPGDAFYTVKVKLATNMRNVEDVYVIANLMKTEQEAAESTQSKEEL